TTAVDASTTLPATTVPSDTTTGAGKEGTTASSNAPWLNDRLPLTLFPDHYTVTLRPVLEMDVATSTYYFHGSSSVRYLCNVSTDYVIMHSNNELTYNTPVTIKDNAGNDFPIESVNFVAINEYIVIKTTSPCEAGKMYTMFADDFTGELGDDLTGIYRSEYKNEAGVNRVIAISQMETTGARHTFPCFDEPAFKATFDFTLYHRSDQGFYAVANMPPIMFQTEMIDTVLWNSTTFDTTYVMSTYLLAVTVSDFLYEPATSTAGVQTYIYARPETIKNNEGVFAAEVTPALLDTIATHYDIPYTLPKSDQMAVADFGAGAMENWGLVLYRETLLLFDENISSVHDKYSITQVIGHELGHQWFGNLVTCAWWNEIWLNEGFASYVQYIAVDGVKPEYKPWEIFIIDDLQIALSADAYSNSHPLVHPEGRFSSITYSKGASFLRMVQSFLGETTFTGALKKYLNDQAFSTGTHDILFQHWIDEASANGLTFPYPLQNVFECWSLQMGYPLISVTRITPNTIRLTQEYFLIDPNDSPVDTPGSLTYKYQWYVPFTYRGVSEFGSTTITTEWMGQLTQPTNYFSATFTNSEDYILGNIKGNGFYRINYDLDMWGKLSLKLKDPSFKVQNRAQLVDDIFALSRSGRIDISLALDLATYMVNEDEYIPWQTFLDAMTYCEYMLGASPIYGDFSKYILDLVVPSIYADLGWDDSNTSDSALITRGEAIDAACTYGNQDCIDNAVMLFDQWRNDTTTIISSTYRTDVFCTAIREGGLAEWDFAWEQYLLSQNAQFQSSLRYGLSCSKDAWVLNRYLEYAMDPTKVRKQDIQNTFSYIARQEYGKYTAWAFAMNNWDRVINQY
uniref:Aminopeptidase n=1 Tax=Ciona savignyi TaxID=51511 RepID=H2YKR7_CIOSA